MPVGSAETNPLSECGISPVNYLSQGLQQQKDMLAQTYGLLIGCFPACLVFITFPLGLINEA